MPDQKATDAVVPDSRHPDQPVPHKFAGGAIASGEALFRQPFTFLKSVPTLDWLSRA
jgi:membrane-associated PAP2 superfamily phosphatase